MPTAGCAQRKAKTSRLSQSGSRPAVAASVIPPGQWIVTPAVARVGAELPSCTAANYPPPLVATRTCRWHQPEKVPGDNPVSWQNFVAVVPLAANRAR